MIEKEEIVEPICELCLPNRYICAYINDSPKERLEQCSSLRDCVDEILKVKQSIKTT